MASSNVSFSHAVRYFHPQYSFLPVADAGIGAHSNDLRGVHNPSSDLSWRWVRTREPPLVADLDYISDFPAQIHIEMQGDAADILPETEDVDIMAIS